MEPSLQSHTDGFKPSDEKLEMEVERNRAEEHKGRIKREMEEETEKKGRQNETNMYLERGR